MRSLFAFVIASVMAMPSYSAEQADYRFITDVTPLSDCTLQINKLHPIKYTSGTDLGFRIGFVAHQLDDDLSTGTAPSLVKRYDGLVDVDKDATNEMGDVYQQIFLEQLTSLLACGDQEQNVTLGSHNTRILAVEGDLPTRVPNTRTVNSKALSSNIVLNASDIGLGNVDNTSDANKPVSTAQAASIATKLTIPSGTTSQYVRGDGSLANLPTGGATCYNGTTALSNCISVAKSASVAGGAGVVTFHLTNDGLSTGAALFPNGVALDSLQLRCNDEASSPCSFGAPTLSNSNKTVSFPVTKSSGINVTVLSLTLLGTPSAAANGTVVKLLGFGN